MSRQNGTQAAKDSFSAADEGLIWMREKGMTYRQIAERYGVGACRAQQMFRRALRNRQAFLRSVMHIRQMLAAVPPAPTSAD